jgi:hypothetical protein
MSVGVRFAALVRCVVTKQWERRPQEAERLAHPRRGWKPEFKQERYPPLDGASCSLSCELSAE